MRHRLSDRRAIGGGVDTDRHGLTGEFAGVLDDERMRERALGELPQNGLERGFVGNRERDDDRRRVTGCLTRCVRDLRDLNPYG